MSLKRIIKESVSNGTTVPDNEVADELYHVTFDTYVDSIKEQGLIPKSKKKRTMNPERIYLINLKEHDHESNELVRDVPSKYKGTIVNILIKQLKYFESKESNVVVFQIDKYRLNNYTFYKDPEYEYGIYTTEPIPYEYLKPFNVKSL